MTRFVVLDSEPLGWLCHAKGLPVARACSAWAGQLMDAGTLLVIPEIIDYEIRRELLRTGNRKSILRLDTLHVAPGVVYLPITTPSMRLAARLWADTRKAGLPTADPRALDADVILAAQATLLEEDYGDVIVATANVRHIRLFVNARPWREITIN